MFSSFLQYLCLAPSFTNVLNVYAFCNLHDVCLALVSYFSLADIQLGLLGYQRKRQGRSTTIRLVEEDGSWRYRRC